jgi:HKD family nuclease
VNLAIGGSGGRPIYDRLKALVLTAERVSVAVSYVQLGGWDRLEAALPPRLRSGLRVVCTDQLGITDPGAVRAMLTAGAEVRAYGETRRVYHPKLFIGHRAGAPDLYLLGSANLSRSALTASVEVDVGGEDPEGRLADWFDELFDRRSVPFDSARLARLDIAFRARTRSGAAYQRMLAADDADAAADPGAAADLATFFSLLSGEAQPLNFDHAGNSARNLHFQRDRLHDPAPLAEKYKSEMKLLGWVDDAGYQTRLGRAAAAAATLEEVGRIWIAWLKATPDDQLRRINEASHLVRAKRAFAAFWTMEAEVRGFFLRHCERPAGGHRRTLQTIELLANAGRDVSRLSLDDVRALSQVVTVPDELPAAAQESIADYLRNEGTRGWQYDHRRIALEAWRASP